MRNRSIDNFLSTHDVELISNFIEHSMDRFEKYDGRIRMAPKRFNTDELQKLYIVKYNEWKDAVKTQVPSSSSTCLEIINRSYDFCPIEQFLKTFMQLIEQSIPPNRLQNIHLKLEKGLPQCDFPCPCPAEA